MGVPVRGPINMPDKKELSAGGLRVPVLLSALLLVSQNSGVQAQELPAPSGPQTDQSAAGKEPSAQTSDAIPGHVTPPARGLEPEIRARLDKLLNTSSEGLVEEEIYGAVRLDLRGRFRTVPVATINEKGEVEITDYTHHPQEQ